MSPTFHRPTSIHAGERSCWQMRQSLPMGQKNTEKNVNGLHRIYQVEYKQGRPACSADICFLTGAPVFIICPHGDTSK